MNSSSTPPLLSPGSSTQTDSLIISSTADIQDTKSGHNDHQQQTVASPSVTGHLDDYSKDKHTAHHDNYRITSLKTEYKSNFTPFDQYVYNEITDSFVKQPHQRNTVSNNLLIESRNHPLSASSSNQDLVAHSEAHAQHATSAVSPALEAGVFKPVNGSDANHQHDATSEPWYMEVMKRNEKANEYRFKSELGHNSALLKDFNEQDLVRKSPLGNDPLIEAQILDKQQQLNSSNRFNPHEYKRDHMISHMANNNNFKLPKEPSSNVVGSTRRPLASMNTSRPISRTTATSRARSQSSKGRVATASAKPEPITKSNQTTPTKTVPSRVSTTQARPAFKSAASSTKTVSKTLSNGTSGRPDTASTGRPRVTSAAPSRMMPPKTTASTIASRASNGPSSTRLSGPKASTTTTTARVSTRTAAPSSATAAPRSPLKRPTNSTTSTSNRPLTASRPSTTRYSKTASSATSKQAPSSTATSAVKSIKTRALVDAGEKTAALAAGLSAKIDPVADQKPALQENNPQVAAHQEPETHQTGVGEAKLFETNTKENVDYNNLEPNLIIMTTEGGNMLADELAQAEKAANESILKEKLEHAEKESEANDTQLSTDQDRRDSNEVNKLLDDKPSFATESSELVNGLADGLVSTEDRYESSERDVSLDYGTQQSGQSYAHHDQSCDHEPYSIMPSTYLEGKKSDEMVIESHISEVFDPNVSAAKEDDAGSISDRSEEILGRSETTIKPIDQNVVIDSPLATQAEDVTEDKQFDEKTMDGFAENFIKNIDQTIVDPQSPADLRNDEQSEQNVEEIDQHDHKIINNDAPPVSEENSQLPLASEKVFNEDVVEQVSATNVRDDASSEMNLKTAEIESNDYQNETIDTESLTGLKRSISIDIEQNSNTQLTSNEHTPSSTQDVAEEHQANYVAAQPEEIINPIDDKLIVASHGDEDVDQKNQSHEQLMQIQQSLEDQTEISNQTGEDIEVVDGLNPHVRSPVEDQLRTSTQNDHAGLSNQTVDDPINTSESETDSDDEKIVSKNELLMNVSELETIESKKKHEMSRKSELAKEQSNSSTSLSARHPSELLLSVDQLNEHFAQISVAKADGEPKQQENQQNKDTDLVDDPTEADQHVELNQTVLSPDVEINESGSRDLIDAKSEILDRTVVESEEKECIQSPGDLLNFGSITPTNDQTILESDDTGTQWNYGTLKSQKEDTGSKTFDTFEVNKQPVNEGVESRLSGRNSFSDTEEIVDMNQDKQEDSATNIETESNQATKSTTSIDDIDDEEQLKLSNHLTNSDDDVILEPRNRKDSLSEAFSPHRAVSPSRYNEGAGLGLMVQEDEVGTVELADGSSAEIVAPTVAENRVEVFTSKSMMPEISQAATFIHPSKLTQEYDDYDENEDWNLNPSADPIDVAATMSPSSSVAEEMLRLSRQASLTNALAGVNVSGDIPLASEVEANRKDSRASVDKFTDLAGFQGHATRDEPDLSGSSSSSVSSLSYKQQHGSKHSVDASERKSEHTGGIDVNPINNNDIDNVDNRKQNIDINSDRNGIVKQAEDKQGQGSLTTTTELADQADKTVPVDQMATDADVTLSTN